MVWIVEWTEPNQGEVSVSVWDSEKEARKSACHDILVEIGDAWDLDDEDIKQTAMDINGAVGSRDYKRAMQLFYDFQCDNSDYEYVQFWQVYERPLKTRADEPALLMFSDPDEEEEEDEEEELEDEEEEVYQATSPGATCRGPCGNFSPDAYADQRDGTFCCYQCKMMSQVFGSKAP